MNYDLVRGLYDAFDELEDDRSCRVIVLTGAGRGFCAGLDLTEGASPPTDRGAGSRAGGHDRAEADRGARAQDARRSRSRSSPR